MPVVRRKDATRANTSLPAATHNKVRLVPLRTLKYNLVNDGAGGVTVQNVMSCLYYTVPLSDETISEIFILDQAGNIEVAGQELTVMEVAARGGTPATHAYSQALVLLYAYTAIAGMAKPITQDNYTYVIKRVKAIGASLKNTYITNLSETDPNLTALLSPLVWSPIHDNMRCAPHPDLPLSDAATCATTLDINGAPVADPQATELHKALEAGFRLILRGYGMTGVRQMAYFCTIVTKALLLDVVLTEAEAFKREYERVKNALGDEDFEYARVLNLAGIDDLSARRFPHLYTCAMGRLVDPTRATTMRNYKMSDFSSDLRESRVKLVSYAQTELKSQTVATQALIDRVSRLTGANLNLVADTALDTIN